MSLRLCFVIGVTASLTAGALCALAYHAANLLAEGFTSSEPGVPLP